MTSTSDEAERRRRLAAQGATDRERWSDPSSLAPSWDARAKIAADFVPRGARVLDLGCGAMALERLLPQPNTYLPCDLVKRDARTILCDFNAGEFPSAVPCDIAVALGVLEYLNDVPAFLRQLRALNIPVVLSYHVDGEGPADRRALGWVNDYTRRDLPELFTDAGFTRAIGQGIGHGQMVMRLEPAAAARVAEKNVWVLSYGNADNFGDRLGKQLLSQVLPAHATVRHIHHEPFDAPIVGAPDLLILGLGNSLFAPLLTDQLDALLDRAPLSIGIFGTQLREAFSVDRLTRVIDRLDTWYARYEEDALLYGAGRSNVRHLGDWLIDVFPMARPANEDTLTIDADFMADQSLDRVIAKIQSYNSVRSGRLHPLLCALTSAETVGYHDQIERETGALSGKFRSMLLDVFGMEWPATKMWAVDRSAVVGYKARVATNIAALRADLARLLA